MTTFDSLADEQWQIHVDDYDVNDPTICYPAPDRKGSFVGPLVTVHVGTTVEDDDGDEVLDLDCASGRNLLAVACLPQFAELFRWMRAGMDSLNPIHFDSQTEYGRFMRELRERMEWITALVDQRPETLGEGEFVPKRFQRGGK